MKEHLQSLDTLNINLGSGDMLLVNCILAFVMFGVALSIRVSTFKSILKNPKSVIWGLMLQWFALPALTCLLTIILNPIITPMVALGMILVASCPGGNVSNFLSSLSKGNVELSVSMTAITTLFASIITPFNFWFWGTHYCKFVAIRSDIPTLDIPFSEMLSQIILILGFPIALGLLFSHYFPKVSKKIIKPSQILSIICFIAMVIVSMSQVLSGFEQRWSVYAAILCALVIVVIHNFTALSAGFYGGTLWESFLAQQGYVVVCVDGRGTGGRGAAFKNCTYLELGLREADDQVETAKYLATLPYVDKNRIGIWGWSFGGYNTLMSMSTGEAVFKAGIAVAPPTYWKFYDSVYTERFMRTPQENGENYDKTSALSRAANLNGSLLLMHGMADDNVHVRNSMEYSEALVQADKQFDMHYYTNRNHSIYGGNTRYHIFTKMFNFWNEKLK